MFLPLLLACAGAPAQELLPDPSFERLGESGAAWTLEGKGEAIPDAAHGARAARVRADGGESVSVWRSPPVALSPAAFYHLRWHGRGNTGGGCAIAGLDRVNRDAKYAAEEWTSSGFVFAAPAGTESARVRFGQWHTGGHVDFDHASLRPAQPLHADGEAGTLGEGESIRGGVYRFEPNFSWLGSNAHRPRVSHTAGFNTDRWTFGPGEEVVYRFERPGRAQREVSVRVGLTHHTAGALSVEGSTDGSSWQELGTLEDKRQSGTFALPPSSPPATVVWVRLRLPGAGGMQVGDFAYQATLADEGADGEGATHWLVMEEQVEGARLRAHSFHAREAEGVWELGLEIEQPGAGGGGRAAAWVGGADSVPGSAWSTLPTGRLARVALRAPFGPPGAQRVNVRVESAADGRIAAGAVEARLGLLSDRRAGYWLAQSDGLSAWWCESGWKVGRERGPPAAPAGRVAEPIRVSAARREYEAAQVVLRADRPAKVLAAAPPRLLDPRGQPSPITVDLREVAYVPVVRPSDPTGQRGEHPDPLPPLRLPLALPAGKNQPLWLTFHVPPETPPGRHRGQWTVETSLGPLRFPVEVEVYAFTLPADTHLRSGFGLSPGRINRYHRLETPADRRAVYERYLENFAAHRISPYSFFEYSPIQVRFTGEGEGRRAVVDFTAFDEAARRWLDQAGFTGFRLPLHGMGGGTFHSRALGKLDGHGEGTPEHARLFGDYLGQVERHLAARGWLGKAYTYWFDEPDPKDYAFVVAGQRRIRAAAPGLKRLLTEQPESELLGDVDLWCALTPEWSREKIRARREAGQEVWWYICCAPHAPYVTEFIDHPGLELRLWPWQSWHYGAQGLLVWETTYWSSDAAFPPPRLQDPWRDPMSYVTDYGYQPGQIGYWGNGDGRFLYPPRRDPNAAVEPDLSGPIPSLRWENLRDGMEDYEYLWLLRAAMDRAGVPAAERELLEVPAAISADLTRFTDDPRVLLERRAQIARRLEQLAAGDAAPGAEKR